MSNHDDDLTRALRQRARALPETPLTLDVVRARAKRIQRARRIAVVASAAAAVAIIAPLGLLLANNQPRSEGPSHEPSVSSTPSPSGSTSTSPSTSPPATSATPGKVVPIDTTNVNAFRNAFPITYWSEPDSGIVTTSGPIIPVDGELFSVAQVGDDQWIGMILDEQGNWQYDSFDQGGELAREKATDGSIAITPDRSSYAYLSLDTPDEASPGVWTIREGGAFSGKWTLDQKPPDGSGVRGILPDGTVVVELGEGNVFLTRPGGKLEAWSGKALKVLGVSTATGRIAVRESSGDNGTCAQVTDEMNRLVARTCAYDLGSFTADGRYIIGLPSYHDGPGVSEVSILDADTLEPVVTFKAARDDIISSDVAWAGHDLLAQVWSDGAWGLMQLYEEPQQGAGGTFQTGTYGTPTKGGYESPLWHFGAGPVDVPQF